MNRNFMRRTTRASAWAFTAITAACLTGGLVKPVSAQQGTWTQLTNAPGFSTETAELLTDGTVMVHSFDNYKNWYALKPDPSGSYINGTWSQLAGMITDRLYFPSAVLRDGRFWVGGGEYLANGTSEGQAVETYDPVTNQWTAAPDGPVGPIGDSAAMELADGRVLTSNVFTTATAIFNPTTNSWSSAASMLQDSGNEATWRILQDGSILNAFKIGQRYIPSENRWIATGPYPNPLVDPSTEIGPMVMLYNGQCLVIGALPHTALFTTPSNIDDPGSWVAGPDIPNGYDAGDTPGCVEVNGKVLMVAAPQLFGQAYFFEYDPNSNTISSITGPPITISQDFTTRMLALPNGQILLSGTGGTPWVYTPSAAPSLLETRCLKRHAK